MAPILRERRALPISAWILPICGGLLAILPAARAADEVTAVFSKVVSKDYVRKKLPDGSYQPEEYFLKDGGRYDKPSGDASIDNKSYLDIAGVIAEQLATQNYHPAKALKTGKLIIVVHWGTTIPPGSEIKALKQTSSLFLYAEQKGSGTSGGTKSFVDSHAMTLYAFDNAQRISVDAKNASLLGYDWEGINDAPIRFNFDPKNPNAVPELEGQRYFVVLLVYDFKAFLLNKQYKELWETRFSVSTHDTDFTKALPKMAKDAANYFGLDSNGLQHLPEGKVKVGEVKSLGEVADKPPQK
jgi:hypothetical protein